MAVMVTSDGQPTNQPYYVLRLVVKYEQETDSKTFKTLIEL